MSADTFLQIADRLAVPGLGLVAGGAVAPTTGCAAFVAAIPLVSEIVSDGLAILATIEGVVNSYFAAHPSASQVAISNALTRTRLALVAGEQALAGIQSVSAGQQAAAFADFAAAYGDLMQLVAPLGIAPAQPVPVLPYVDAGAGPGDGGARVAVGVPVAVAPQVVIPVPLALRVVRAAAQ